MKHVGGRFDIFIHLKVLEIVCFWVAGFKRHAL